MSDQKENEAKPVQVSKNPIYWIPFSVAAIFLVIIGLFRFSDSSDSIYFICISRACRTGEPEHAAR